MLRSVNEAGLGSSFKGQARCLNDCMILSCPNAWPKQEGPLLTKKGRYLIVKAIELKRPLK